MNIINKIHFALLKNGVKRAEYLRKKNILAGIGKDCLYQPFAIPMDPKLLKMHDNVFVAAGVKFCTHDASRNMLGNKNKREYAMNLGCIEVGNNVFIGLNSIIMGNIEIGDNVIVAAGSVVTKSVPDGVIVGGDPAIIIGKFDEYDKKMQDMTSENGILGYNDAIKAAWASFKDDKKRVMK